MENKLVDQILNAVGDDGYIFDESPLVNAKDVIVTDYPILNIAMSGQVDRGMAPGILMIAGPSKHFKSLFSLILASAYMKDNPEAVMVFLDTEGGMPIHYFKSCKIDTKRVIHVTVPDVHALKHKFTNIMDKIERDAPVLIVLDSLGGVASMKEIEDAKSGNTSEDMTRAKHIKSFTRIAMSYIISKRIPMIMINHTYKEMSMYPRDIVSGGTGVVYSSNDIWIIGRRQIKEGKEVVGNEFVIRVEKSRKVLEKSEFPVKVTHKRGLEKYSGLFDIAMDLGYIVSEKKGWYKVYDPSLGEITNDSHRRSEIENDAEYWEALLSDEGFKEAVKNRYSYKKVLAE